MARATDGVDSFRLGDADAREVAEMCRSLDGLPLAIELAATRVETFGVSGLRSQLEDRLLLLLTGRRAGPPRHRTLAAAIDSAPAGWAGQLPGRPAPPTATTRRASTP